VLDSIQYMNLKVWQVQTLMETFKNKKSIIVISWAVEGGLSPKGAVAKATEYMFGVKTSVNNGSAVSKSRYGATIPYEVYPPREIPTKKKGRKKAAEPEEAEEAVAPTKEEAVAPAKKRGRKKAAEQTELALADG
jgi:hypothetical protein